MVGAAAQAVWSNDGAKRTPNWRWPSASRARASTQSRPVEPGCVRRACTGGVKFAPRGWRHMRPVPHPVLKSVHRERFAAPRLPIGEHSGVIPVEGGEDEVAHAAPLEEVLLRPSGHCQRQVRVKRRRLTHLCRLAVEYGVE